MPRERIDIQSFDGTLGDLESATLVLDTQTTETILFTVDSGDTGVRAPKYTLKVSVDQDVGFGFQEVEELTVSKTQTLSHTNPAYGRYMQFEVINESGSSGRFRVVAESMRIEQ